MEMRWFLCICALMCAMLSAHAAAERRMALVIGNAAYQGEKPLRNPGNDAQDIAAALQRAGVSVQRHTNLGRTEMNRVIESFMQAAEGAELALVYYSGHGMQAGGEAFLIPVDAKIQSERDVRSEGIRLSEMMDDLEARRIRNTLLIIDACRDNPFRSRSKSSAKGLARPKEMNGAFLVAYATADGTTADDGEGRNGKYTEQLLGQLSQPGKSLRDIVEDTQLAVEKSTNGTQRPKNYGDTAKFRSISLRGAVQIASVNPEPSGRQALGDPDEDAWQATKAANTVAAYDAYLSEFPKGRYASAARIGKIAIQPQTSAPSQVQQRPISGAPQVQFLTNMGEFVIEVYPEKAPKTVDNFLRYVNDKHYDGSTFHRVIDDFMIQGGGYTAAMSPIPTRPPIALEALNGLKNDTGTVAMARTASPDSATSQFFINVKNNDYLNAKGSSDGYTVFGRVVSGMDVVNRIKSTPTGAGNVPKTAVVIHFARLLK
jgi:peptidyl-prolyl cis-trans isomerase A (cyclophilin A)